jgi:thiol-disulfide isomerase/thioredoxin
MRFHATMRPRRIRGLFAMLCLGLIAAPLLNLQSTACAQDSNETADKDSANPFPGRLPAPSLDGGVEWFNTAEPIDIRDLRGKIVLLDFWTYCCINCMHILPDLKYLEHKYKNDLVVIGVHSPKFDNEQDSDNIRDAILRYEIEHPVVNDANRAISERYAFRAWPQLVLIDPQGQYVGYLSGEGIREPFDDIIGQMVAYHRQKGTLDETPVRFELERDKVPPGPLKYPGKLLADEAGRRLFISDSNHNRIVISTLDGGLQAVVGTGAVGADDGGYDAATFNRPQGMELVGNTLYVADTENHLIRTIDLRNRTVGRLAGTGKQSRVRLPGGPLQGTALNSPWDLQELNGTLYVAMAGPHQLWKHELGSNSIEVFAGTGREDILDGPLDACALAQPSGIVTDGKVLYFVDSEGSAVRRATLGAEGEVTTLVGTHDLERGRSLFEFGDIDGAGDRARLQHPIGLAYHDGLLYVADTYNHKIKQIDPRTRMSRTWLGTGEAGLGLNPTQLSEPAGLTVAGGRLFIADTNNHRILTADLATREVAEFTIDGLAPPDPPARIPVNDADEEPAVELAAQKVKAGESLRFDLSFLLPLDFKLNSLFPIRYTLKAVGDQTLIPADDVGVRHETPAEGHDASFEVPLSGKALSGTYELALEYSFCRSGEGGVCRFGSARWRIPVEIDDGAEADAVQLTIIPGD